jgi:hypothetical protein
MPVDLLKSGFHSYYKGISMTYSGRIGPEIAAAGLRGLC